MKNLVLILGLALLGGCNHAGQGPGNLPYRYWYMSFLAPDYMEVWVETANVEDIRGKVFLRANSGTARVNSPSNNRGNPAFWPKHSELGRYVEGADLPKRIFIRWQSLVEPKTYRVTLEIPERARRLMAEKLTPPCNTMEYRQRLVIGLAPGGVVRVWVRSTCGESIDVLHAQAEINPKGPYNGTSDGEHRPLSKASKAYIEKHGIPYGSW